MNPFLTRALSRVSAAPIRRPAAAAAAATAAPVLVSRPRAPSFVSPPTPRGFLPTAAQAAPFHTRAGGGVGGGHKGSRMPRRPAPPPEAELDEAFLKGSGPGGQKINKTNSAVQLRHRPTGLVVKCQATRSRTENRAIARQLLADRLDDLARGDQSRAAVVGEWRAKKRASSAKKSRRKYRRLEEEKAAAAAAAAAADTADPNADPTPSFDEDILAEPPLDPAPEDRGHGNDMGEPEEPGQRPRPGQIGASQGET